MRYIFGKQGLLLLIFFSYICFGSDTFVSEKPKTARDVVKSKLIKLYKNPAKNKDLVSPCVPRWGMDEFNLREKNVIPPDLPHRKNISSFRNVKYLCKKCVIIVNEPIICPNCKIENNIKIFKFSDSILVVRQKKIDENRISINKDLKKLSDETGIVFEIIDKPYPDGYLDQDGGYYLKIIQKKSTSFVRLGFYSDFKQYLLYFHKLEELCNLLKATTAYKEHNLSSEIKLVPQNESQIAVLLSIHQPNPKDDFTISMSRVLSDSAYKDISSLEVLLKSEYIFKEFIFKSNPIKDINYT